MRRPMPPYIRTLGIELEGGWNCRCATPETLCDTTSRGFPACLPTHPTATLKTDTSVQTNAHWNGEFACGPYVRHAPWHATVRTLWPHEVNDTCGMHLHLGCYNDDVYARFLTPTFETYLLDGLDGWASQRGLKADHPFWSRLAGRNTYCLHGYAGDEQANATGPSAKRHRVCNYTWQYKGTIEIRVLPMFADHDLAFDAIERVLTLAEHWAARHRTRLRARSTFILPNDLVEDFHTVQRMAVDILHAQAETSSTEIIYTCASS